jgi:hypothetical protein
VCVPTHKSGSTGLQDSSILGIHIVSRQEVTGHGIGPLALGAVRSYLLVVSYATEVGLQQQMDTIRTAPVAGYPL